MRMAGLALTFLLGASLPAFAEAPPPASAPQPVRVQLGDVTDSRSSGQFFKQLKVELKLSGDAIFNAFSIGDPVITEARDNTGRVLTKDEKRQGMLWLMEKRNDKSDTANATAELLNPARSASTVSLRGTIPVYSPASDPASIVTLPNIGTLYGKPLNTKEGGLSLTVFDKKASEAAKAARSGGMIGQAMGQMLMGGMDDNSLRFKVKDPHSQLLRIDVIGPDGKELETQSRSHTSANGEDDYTYSYRQPVGETMSLRLYYATQASFQQVPFSFDEVPLP